VGGSRKGRGWGEDAKRENRRKSISQAKDNQSGEGEEDAEDATGETLPSVGDITNDEPQVISGGHGEVVQVVHKIDSFESGAGKYIIFSAVGSVFLSSFGFLGD
jgi:hypothetical protein